MSFIPSTLHILLGELFYTNFSTHFCKILKESNFGLFQASGIIHVLPKINFWLFQMKSNLILDPSKALSFFGELHRFFYIKSVILDFLVLIEMI